MLRNPSLIELKALLKWDEIENDEEWFDRFGIGIVFYAVVQNSFLAIKELIQSLENVFEANERRKALLSCIPSGGLVEFNLIEGMSSLDAAMVYVVFECVYSSAKRIVVRVVVFAGVRVLLTTNCALK